MNKYRNLIYAYLKFRDCIPPINDEDKNLILSSKDELNRQFDIKHLKTIDIINDCLGKINRINTNDGLLYDYLNQIYQDLLYFSFSSSGYPIREPQIDNVSNYKVSQLSNILNSLKEAILSKESATDIIDTIEEEFAKLKK